MCKEGFQGAPVSNPHKSGHRGVGSHGAWEDFFGPFMGKNWRSISHIIRGCFHGFMKQYEGWVPYNLQDRGDHYLILVPLSGRTKDDVKVSLINNMLNITAKKPEFVNEYNKEKKDEIPFIRNFFAFVDVNLDIPLPADVNKDAIKSLMQNGLLKVKISKNPPTNIDIIEEPDN